MRDKDKQSARDLKPSILNLVRSVDESSDQGRAIAGIRKKYYDTRDELNRFSIELDLKMSLISKESDRLKSLHGELALNEKETREVRDELLLLKKNHMVLENPELVMEEFRRQEAELSALEEKEHIFGKGIMDLERKLRQDLEAAGVIEIRLKEINTEIAHKKPERDELAEEFSKLEKVASVFVERDELESEVAELESAIKDRSKETASLRQVIDEHDKELPELKKTVEALKKKLEHLEKLAKESAELLNERTSLRGDIATLEPELEEEKAKAKALQSEFEEKDEEFQELSQGNEDMKSSIRSIEEAIARFDETLQEINKAKKILQDSAELNEEAVTELDSMFAQKVTVVPELLLVEETIESIIKSIEAAK